MGRPFAAPPGIPADRAAALRKAFDAVLKDPALLADAKKQNLEIDPITGQEITELMARLYGTPKTVAERVRNFRTGRAGERDLKKGKKK
jgi:tripartite-type tricarboxylate transporter receptor subunit TctC